MHCVNSYPTPHSGFNVLHRHFTLIAALRRSVCIAEPLRDSRRYQIPFRSPISRRAVMWGETKQSTSSKTSLIYLTLGALTVVWTTITYIYLRRSEGNEGSIAYLFCYGFMLTGIVLIAIGMLVGYIGRAAMRAEVAATPAMVMTPTAPAVVNTAPQSVPSPALEQAPTPRVAATGTVPQVPVRPVSAV